VEQSDNVEYAAATCLPAARWPQLWQQLQPSIYQSHSEAALALVSEGADIVHHAQVRTRMTTRTFGERLRALRDDFGLSRVPLRLTMRKPKNPDAEGRRSDTRPVAERAELYRRFTACSHGKRWI